MAASLREIRKGMVRDQIVKAATELFLEQDIRQVTMRKVAERVHYSPMALYAYFPSKPALLRGVTESLFQLLEQALSASLAGRNSPRECLVAAAKAYLEFGLDHPRQYQFLFNASWVMDLQDCTEQCPGECGTAPFEQLQQLVSANMVPEKRNPGCVLQTSLLWWAALHGLTSLMIAMPKAPFVPADVPDALVETILSGCVAKGLFFPDPRSRTLEAVSQAANQPDVKQKTRRARGGKALVT